METAAEAITTNSGLGVEVALPTRFQDGDEYAVTLAGLVAHGTDIFVANWTGQEGGGRPKTKGTGNPLTDQSSPLVFPRNFNRLSGPDSNSCGGCHNAPYGIPGGGGDIANNVNVLGQRFDFLTFDGTDTVPLRGTMNELGHPVTQQTSGDFRATLGMFGSGYVEMLAREMTADLRAERDATPAGGTSALSSKGISFGSISRDDAGAWIVSGVVGLPAPSLVTTGPASPPNLIVRPFHQAGNVVSIRQFTVNALTFHHGIQATERFGIGTDQDGDGFTNELSRADVTALTVMQATMAVPGRVIPRNKTIEAAVANGEALFASIGCTTCHVTSLPLDGGNVYIEPNPYNPAGNLQKGQAPDLIVDLASKDLPSPRLAADEDMGVVTVPLYSDLKLHDITTGPGDPNEEALDMNQAPGSSGFFAGNRKFITRKLWGAANEPPYFHHGKFTTMREAILNHHGEAQAQYVAFTALSEYDQASVIEFLKTLQVLRPGTKSLVVDENGHPRKWRKDGNGNGD